MVNSYYKCEVNFKIFKRESNGTHIYKMILEKFQGKDDENFDIWWEDLQAFFPLCNRSSR